MKKKVGVPKDVSAYFAKCGRKSAAKLTPEERTAKARKAALKMWALKKADNGNS